MEQHIDPKLIANLWDKYVVRSQASDSLEDIIEILKKGGYSSSEKFVSPIKHNQIQFEIYKVGKSLEQPNYGKTLCYKATEKDLRDKYPFNNMTFHFKEKFEYIPILNDPSQPNIEPILVEDFLDSIIKDNT